MPQRVGNALAVDKHMSKMSVCVYVCLFESVWSFFYGIRCICLDKVPCKCRVCTHTHTQRQTHLHTQSCHSISAAHVRVIWPITYAPGKHLPCVCAAAAKTCSPTGLSVLPFVHACVWECESVWVWVWVWERERERERERDYQRLQSWIRPVSTTM